ncbi:YlqD family protein [Caldisericum sp. AR60]|uniref:YlqD family protein n=1 Tax=Caldisericum sp. AR60 TaxID=3397852 RepID=UPI0039FDA2F2
MSVLHLKQNVIVKVIVTEKFKEDFKRELSRQLETAESKARELKSSLARLVIESAGIQNPTYVESLKARIEEERMLQEAIASDLREKLKEVDALSIDSIYPYTVIEGLVDIDVGDNLFKKIAGVEVIIKDGVVIEIKEGT